MAAADRVPELLTDVLSGRKTDPVVGGEPSRGLDAWTFEAPTCPDPAGGWDEWLARVLNHRREDGRASHRAEWALTWPARFR